MTSRFDPPAEIAALVGAMDSGVRAAEHVAERYCTEAGGVTRALHHCAPFSMEIQKLAEDAHNAAMAAFASVTADGGEHDPLPTTINPDCAGVLTAVTVYPTSRPHVRLVLGDRLAFGDVAAELVADVHCEAATGEHARKLACHKLVGETDCIAEMAETVARQRKVFDYYESELKLVGSTPFPEPEPISAGILFPVAMGNGVVVLKFCLGHALALIAKYEIRPEQCGVEEPWEGIGNHW